MGVIVGMSGLDGRKVGGCTGAFTFLGRGRLKLVVLPLKALMLMVSFASASSDENEGVKVMVMTYYDILFKSFFISI
jgi:hypothetical protein